MRSTSQVVGVMSERGRGSVSMGVVSSGNVVSPWLAMVERTGDSVLGLLRPWDRFRRRRNRLAGLRSGRPGCFLQCRASEIRVRMRVKMRVKELCLGVVGHGASIGLTGSEVKW